MREIPLKTASLASENKLVIIPFRDFDRLCNHIAGLRAAGCFYAAFFRDEFVTVARLAAVWRRDDPPPGDSRAGSGARLPSAIQPPALPAPLTPCPWTRTRSPAAAGDP